MRSSLQGVADVLPAKWNRDCRETSAGLQATGSDVQRREDAAGARGSSFIKHIAIRRNRFAANTKLIGDVETYLISTRSRLPE